MLPNSDWWWLMGTCNLQSHHPVENCFCHSCVSKSIGTCIYASRFVGTLSPCSSVFSLFFTHTWTNDLFMGLTNYNFNNFAWIPKEYNVIYSVLLTVSPNFISQDTLVTISYYSLPEKNLRKSQILSFLWIICVDSEFFFVYNNLEVPNEGMHTFS